MTDYDALEEAIGADMAIDKLTEENERLRKHIRLLEEYNELMGAELEELIPSADNRGWTSTRYEEGVRLRAEIAVLGAPNSTADEIVKTEPIKGGRRLVCRVCEKHAYWLNFDQICVTCL